VVAEIRDAGGEAIASHADISQPTSGDTLISDTINRYGCIDAIIHNAGNMRCAAFDSAPASDLQAMLEVHLIASYRLTQAAWPHFKNQCYARVVFTTSSAAQFGSELHAGYAAAKGALAGLLRVLALKGEPHGILCNGLMPTAFTRMTDTVQQHKEDGNASAEQLRALVGDAMKPEFSAGLAVFLASERCTFSGEVYSSCAGRMALVATVAARGWQGSRASPSTIGDIEANIAAIRDLTPGVVEPASASDEFKQVLMTALQSLLDAPRALNAAPQALPDASPSPLPIWAIFKTPASAAKNRLDIIVERDRRIRQPVASRTYSSS